jgi:hypothetical protein
MMPNRLETKPTSPLPSGLHLALLLGVLLMLIRGANAQPPPPSDPNNVTGGAGVPIDGGLSILMAAGAGLGLKKAWDARKSTPTEGDSEASDEEQSTTAGPLDS